jgi:6-phosphofructokinase 1
MNFAILTSGGDSPGMNAAIRAFVRSLHYHGHKTYGIMRGYSGLIENDIEELSPKDVGNIIQRGGTILKTSRSQDYLQKKVRLNAYKNLKKLKISGLCVIGGDGSYNGAYTLYRESGIPVIGIPGTIDNDIINTDYTIGHETAVQNAIEAIDKIRDTALSHDRVFFIEVMGKNSSALCQRIALCTGAEMSIDPKSDLPDEEIVKLIKRGQKRGKKSSIFIVAENEVPGRSYDIQKLMFLKHKINSHVCILGHIQRGGAPVAMDRYFATLMGAKAAEFLAKKSKHVQAAAMVIKNSSVQTIALHKCLTKVERNDALLSQLLMELSV